MPGKKGVKLMPRLSKSGKWNSVKELVFSLLEKNPNIRKQEVDKEVEKEYPTASFLKHGEKRGHFAWYKHRFMRMKLEESEFNIKEPSREVKIDESVEDNDAPIVPPKTPKAKAAKIEPTAKSTTKGKTAIKRKASPIKTK